VEPGWTSRCATRGTFVAAIKGLLDELADLHPGEIAGFWIEREFVRFAGVYAAAIPELNYWHNNDGAISATPTLTIARRNLSATRPCRLTRRPSGLVRHPSRWNILPPRSDYNEDIPTSALVVPRPHKDNDPRFLGLSSVKTPYIRREGIGFITWVNATNGTTPLGWGH